MSVAIVHTEKAPKAIGPYSQAIQAGNWLFCSGQVAIDPTTGHLIEGDIDAQTQQALTNLKAVLKAAGLKLDDVVKTTVFLKNFDDFPKMNAVYAQAFGDHRPARSTVEVSRLPLGSLVEIECVARSK